MTIVDEPPDFGIDHEPAYADLFPGAAPPTYEEMDSWAPVDLTSLPDKPPVQPTLGASTGVGLVYPGKRHVFSGPPESAKTIAAYAITLQVVRDGGRAVLIDFEMGGYDARNRLRDLGAADADLGRILYLEPNDPATPERIDRLIALQPHLVTVDAAAGAYDLEGLDDNKRQDVEKLSRLYVTRFWRAGIATIFVDHVVKNTETRGKFVIGSERKLGGADVHIGFETINPISRGTRGLYKILTHKDRGGYLKRGHLANLDLTSDPHTHEIAWAFKPVTSDTADDGHFRPTTLMEKVSVWLELQHDAATHNEIKAAVEGKKQAKGDAIRALVIEGFAAEEDGPNRSKLVRSVRAYRAKDPACNPENDANAQVVPGGSQWFPEPDDASGSSGSHPLQGGATDPPSSTHDQQQLSGSHDDPDADIPF